MNKGDYNNIIIKLISEIQNLGHDICLEPESENACRCLNESIACLNNSKEYYCNKENILRFS